MTYEIHTEDGTSERLRSEREGLFTSLEAAQAALADRGGWLLDLGPAHQPVYQVTEDKGIVHDVRGQGFIDRCEQLQCWDETDVPASDDA